MKCQQQDKLSKRKISELNNRLFQDIKEKVLKKNEESLFIGQHQNKILKL
jgi:hypothetical protein